ncbi:PREDICTED: uncharacterized protein LOC100641674 isoform X2 [Amphimedon queenslandica]|uniref:Integrase core domain-containing protein n=1 Tax=Amphimedon queenslandica TaxID=400682 RepID=A0AAN0J0A2_AMPQE|nr:PREDICTED: uncharacterized protein LOC100641674 isoform X2 [Amphimedon queenslandica]|eukprot:XP_019850439.1 PREDICTED: uncharacterized protein LOC100641674 isoform X2 [Amphimedon queenslandica]
MISRVSRSCTCSRLKCFGAWLRCILCTNHAQSNYSDYSARLAMEKAREKELLKRLICQCHITGCTNKEIQSLLRPLKFIHIRYIQRTLKEAGYSTLQRRDSIEKVKIAINIELHGSGCLLGYRSMWHRLKKKYNLSVTRDVVMMLLATMDAAGTTQRKSRRLNRRIYLNKGPNYLWHMDGYDKLKPYGIAIHGCIDGYSRKILWLKAGSSNNDPHIIAHHYVECVRCNGCPSILRSDLGTENSLVSVMQPILRHYHTDSLAGPKSFLYGRSVNNQRIESLWCQLRKQHADWWINFLRVWYQMVIFIFIYHTTFALFRMN